MRSENYPYSLYVHVPFCLNKKCDYCDFYSVPVNACDSSIKYYIENILEDADQLFAASPPKIIPTLYIGGGTPSILGAEGLQRLLGGLLNRISHFCPQPEEITIEANPESADDAFLIAANENGATRLSLGIQTFHLPSRKTINRGGKGDSELLLNERLALVVKYFPDSFSVDLISGLPFQNESILANDIKTALSFKPAHISFYALTVKEETPLAKKLADGLVTLPSKDEADRLWLFGRDLLEEAGYSQYEVSNFCLPGKESLHNIRYWRMLNWHGLGPGASGTIIDDETGTGFRYLNPEISHTEAQRRRGRRTVKNGKRLCAFMSSCQENLDKLTLIKETFLMGFRYIKGPDQDLFKKRFGCRIGDLIPLTLKKWADRGLLDFGKNALTKGGLLLLDSFLLDVFRELDTCKTIEKQVK